MTTKYCGVYYEGSIYTTCNRQLRDFTGILSTLQTVVFNILGLFGGARHKHIKEKGRTKIVLPSNDYVQRDHYHLYAVSSASLLRQEPLPIRLLRLQVS